MIKIKDIMIKDVIYYEPEIEDNLKTFCKKEKITYLPSLDLKKVYFLHYEAFKNKEIEGSLIISPDLNVFDESLLKLFQEGEHILFIFDQNLIVGIIHISDYNRVEVYKYLYELIANLERDLRKLLDLSELSNDDMGKFFKMHADKKDKNAGFYKKKYSKFKDDSDKFHEVGPFEFFELSDLVALCNNKKIVHIDPKVIELRRKVMHSRSGIKNKDYEQNYPIYDFTSFETFFNDVIILQVEFKRIHNRVKIHKYIARMEENKTRHSRLIKNKM